MVTKGIVVDKNGNKYKVRIPIYHGAPNTANSTPDNELPWAVVSASKNYSNPYSIGDVVFICFEQNDTGRPIIAGELYREFKDIQVETDAIYRNLETRGVTNLVDQTWIGKTNPIDFKNIQNSRENIQFQIDELRRQLNELDQYNSGNNIISIKNQNLSGVTPLKVWSGTQNQYNSLPEGTEVGQKSDPSTIFLLEGSNWNFVGDYYGGESTFWPSAGPSGDMCFLLKYIDTSRGAGDGDHIIVNSYFISTLGNGGPPAPILSWGGIDGDGHVYSVKVFYGTGDVNINYSGPYPMFISYYNR